MSEETQGLAEVYTFAKPFIFEGQDTKEVTLDFGNLSGNDIISCDRQYRAEQRGGISLAPEMDKAYLAYVVAKAAGVHVELIRTAKAKDFTALTLRARNFFAAVGCEDSEVIKDLAVSLAMLTYTPISYFLSLTLEEFRDSVERVNRLRGGRK